MTYKIIRFRQVGRNSVICRGLTLEEAQKHCSDPETSSRTCRRKTRSVWFDGYTAEV